MKTWIIYELQDAQSTREASRAYSGTLESAKRKATRDQFFQGSVLKIFGENGAEVAIKEKGKWKNL